MTDSGRKPMPDSVNGPSLYNLNLIAKDEEEEEHQSGRNWAAERPPIQAMLGFNWGPSSEVPRLCRYALALEERLRTMEIMREH